MPHPRFRSSINLCILMAISMLAPQTLAEKDLARLADAASVAKNWRAVNDTVMGGVSKGGAALNELGHLVFTGELSLENNGGFASIRTRDQINLLDGNDTIQVRLRGDGRTYYLSLRDKQRAMAASHRSPIKTVKNEWMEVSVKLSDFYYTRFGQTQRRAPLASDEVIGIGFTLADKNPGPFKLEIASLVATSSDANSSSDQQADYGSPVDIVATAKQAGQFKTLLAALEATGLDKTLSGHGGKYTVFAPTDGAFAKLPKGTLDELLKPANRGKLKDILLNHVVMSEVSLTQEVKTLQGGSITIEPASSVKIGGATVLKADIHASNGLIHVIDSVLLPKAKPMPPLMQAMRTYELAINRGVPTYNNGDHAGCVAIYKEAANALLHQHREMLTHHDRRMLMQTMEAVRSGNHSTQAQAWALRGALDRAYMSMQSR